MKILGIDTSTPIGSVALIDGESLVAEHTLNIVKAHSSRLMPAIDTVLKWGDITAEELDGCAVGIGPGSFTGIRIGIATIKSLCYALDKPIVGVSTLEAIAYNLRWTEGLICPILDARRNESYGAIFRGGDEWQRLTDDWCLPIEAVLAEIETGRANPQGEIETGRSRLPERHETGKANPQGEIETGRSLLPESENERTRLLQCTFVGDGLETYADAVRTALGEEIRFADAIFNAPRGATVAHLGAQRLKNGDSDNYWTLVPNYVRIGLY